MKKGIKRIIIPALVFITVAVVLFALPYYVDAFHEGGVGYCEGCHDLYGFQGNNEREAGVRGMLRGSDPSSACLRCHANNGEDHNILSNDGSTFTPGGDFYWLKRTFTYNSYGATKRSAGNRHGHNVVARDYGLNEDPDLALADGGSYPTSAMSCISCHNPHGITKGNKRNEMAMSVSGSYGGNPPDGIIAGNYRLLGGIGYNGGSQAGNADFAYDAPVAVANSNDWIETDTNHTAYGSGMSEWCSNCHSEFLNSYSKHPAGNDAKLTGEIITNYNSYMKTGNFSGTQANAYTALVPFELGTSDKSLLNTSSMSGPEAYGKANVMCLTCHRAHASAFEAIGRWDFQATFIADSHPRAGDGGASGNDIINSYYGRDMTAEFGFYQRQLCNKCHVQD